MPTRSWALKMGLHQCHFMTCLSNISEMPAIINKRNTELYCVLRVLLNVIVIHFNFVKYFDFRWMNKRTMNVIILIYLVFQLPECLIFDLLNIVVLFHSVQSVFFIIYLKFSLGTRQPNKNGRRTKNVDDEKFISERTFK